MVETISPKVFGGRTERYWTTIAIHVVVSTITGAVFGAFVGLAGAAVGAPWSLASSITLLLVALLYLAREVFGLEIPIPDRKKQVPEWWRSFFPPSVAAALYGAGLAVGFLTFLTHGTYVVVVAAVFLYGDALAGAAACGAFAFSRSAAVAVIARSEIVENLRLDVPRVANAAATLAAGVAAAAARF